MRTTVTLDADVATQLQELVYRSRKPFKVVLNEAIRRGLGGSEAPKKPRPRFRVQTYNLQLRPGIDERRLNQLADELEVEATLVKLSQGR